MTARDTFRQLVKARMTRDTYSRQAAVAWVVSILRDKSARYDSGHARTLDYAAVVRRAVATGVLKDIGGLMGDTSRKALVRQHRQIIADCATVRS